MTHKIIVIEELPKREYTKKSIYDDILENFEERNIPIAQVKMTKKSDGQQLNGTYLASRLAKRIKEKKWVSVKARAINKEAYLINLALYEEP